MHALEFLKQTAPEIPGVVVLSGSQRHLKHAALTILKQQVIADDEAAMTQFKGTEADLQSVSDELRTVSMWGDRRLVLVENADDFVTKYRPALEKLTDKPAKKSVLVIDVNSFPKTTRLYKQVAAKGLEIDCSDLKGPQLSKWVQETASSVYGSSITREASALLIELVGTGMGMLDTELAKLASYVGVACRLKLTTSNRWSAAGGPKRPGR